MAYLVGFISDEELADLENRGWEFEDPPAELIPKELDEELDKKLETSSYTMVWVDSDLYDIMTGPDWEKSHEPTKRD
jgi:hypothetical protein